MKKFPEVVNGYELEKAEWSLIVPTREDTFNLVENPSLETNTTGYNAIAGAIARSAAESAFGVYSLKCTPGAGINDGCWYGELALNNEHQYFFSLYFIGGDIGQKYRIYFADNIGGRKGGYKEFTAKGYMQRIWVSWFCEYDGNFRFYCVKSGHAGVKPFYIDGLQVEENHFTTYIDGDIHGFLPERNDYYWMGDDHASQSVRIGQSRHGGREVKLKDLGFSLLSILGLGLSGFKNAFTQLAAGGETFDGTYKTGRNFALTGSVTGKSFSELRDRKDKLFEYFSPDFVSPPQPLRLVYRDKKCSDNELFFSVPAVFDGGMEGSFDNYNQERMSLKFHSPFTWVAETEIEQGYNLGVNKYMGNQDTLVIRNSDGSYSPSGFTAGIGEGIAYYKGKIYFVSLDANTILYSMDTKTHVSTVVSVFNGVVFELKVRGSDLYAVGSFTTIDGNPFLRIARYDGTNWNALGAGINNGDVKSIDISDDGTIYIAGNFTNQPVAGNHSVAYYDTSWHTMDGGINLIDPAKPISISVGKDNRIWVGGDFIELNDGSSTVLYYVTYFEKNAFGAAIGHQIYGFNNSVLGVGIGPDGTVYAIGIFTQSSTGSAINHVAYWDGEFFVPLGAGLEVNQYALTGRRIYNIKEGILFVNWDPSYWDRTGEVPGDYSIWNGSAFVPGDHEITTPAGGYYEAQGVIASENNNLLVFTEYIWPFADPVANDIITAEITEVVNDGNFNTWPVIKFYGPGMLRSIKNMTTEKYIWFNLALQEGEVVTLSLDPQNLYFTSNLRGNILSSIYSGSAMTEFYIKPDKNNISVFISGWTGSNTKSIMKFFPVYGSKI